MTKIANFLFLTSIIIFSQHSFATTLISCDPTLEEGNVAVFEIDDIRKRIIFKREKAGVNEWYEHNEELEVRDFDRYRILAISKSTSWLDSFVFSINFDREFFLERSIMTGLAKFNIEDEKNNKKWVVPYYLYSCRTIPKLLPPPMRVIGRGL